MEVLVAVRCKYLGMSGRVTRAFGCASQGKTGSAETLERSTTITLNYPVTGMFQTSESEEHDTAERGVSIEVMAPTHGQHPRQWTSEDRLSCLQRRKQEDTTLCQHEL